MIHPQRITQPLSPGNDRFDTASLGITTTGTCIVLTKPELVEVTLGVRQSSKTAITTRNFIKNFCTRTISQLKMAE